MTELTEEEEVMTNNLRKVGFDSLAIVHLILESRYKDESYRILEEVMKK